MAPKAKTESKPLTQDQIAVITKRVISEYNKKVVEQNEKLISADEVTKALAKYQQESLKEDNKLTKLYNEVCDAEKKFLEFKKQLTESGYSVSSQYVRYEHKEEVATSFDELAFIRTFSRDTDERQKRAHILQNVLKKPLKNVVVLNDNGAYKRAIVPGIGCVYEEIIFQTLDSKTDALQLIQDLLKKATI